MTGVGRRSAGQQHRLPLRLARATAATSPTSSRSASTAARSSAGPSGLVQTTNDPQWPQFSPIYANGLAFGNFTVNPINGNQVIISSNAGRIFAHEQPGPVLALDRRARLARRHVRPRPGLRRPRPQRPPAASATSTTSSTPARSAATSSSPRPAAAATLGAWTNISTGLDGSPVVKIVTDPTRGSHDAYAVTQKGVYYITDSLQAGRGLDEHHRQPLRAHATASSAPTPVQQTALSYLTSIQADWRYVIPIDPKNPGAGTHPVLYVSGEAGVFRSLDNGTTWSPFPKHGLRRQRPSTAAICPTPTSPT